MLDHDFGWDDGLICGGKVCGLILPHAPPRQRHSGANSPARTRAHLGRATDFSIAWADGRRRRTGSTAKRCSPPCALWIAGSGHVAQAVAPLAQQLDFDVTVFDDRPDVRQPPILPGRHAVARRAPGRNSARTAFRPPAFGLIVTRGHQHDALVLRGWIHQPFAFLGMIGSRRKSAASSPTSSSQDETRHAKETRPRRLSRRRGHRSRERDRNRREHRRAACATARGTAARPPDPPAVIMPRAAGASSRMGRPKMLLPWGATTVLGHLLAQWQQDRCGANRRRRRGERCRPPRRTGSPPFPRDQRIVNPDPRAACSVPFNAPHAGPVGMQRSPTGPSRSATSRTSRSKHSARWPNSPRPTRTQSASPRAADTARHPVLLPKMIFQQLASSSHATLKISRRDPDSNAGWWSYPIPDSTATSTHRRITRSRDGVS